MSALEIHPMCYDEFESFNPSAKEDYIKLQVGSGVWPHDEAPAMAEELLKDLIPCGLDSEDQFLRTIRLSGEETLIGYL